MHKEAKAKKAVEILYRDFSDLDSVGPNRVVQFRYGEANEGYWVCAGCPELSRFHFFGQAPDVISAGNLLLDFLSQYFMTFDYVPKLIFLSCTKDKGN